MAIDKSANSARSPRSDKTTTMLGEFTSFIVVGNISLRSAPVQKNGTKSGGHVGVAHGGSHRKCGAFQAHGDRSSLRPDGVDGRV